MSIRVQSIIWDRVPYREATLLVILAMADWANDGGTRIFPTLNHLAEKARITRRATQRILRRLEADGAIQCVRRANGRPGYASEYRIIIAKLQQMNRTNDCDSPCKGATQSHSSTGDVRDSEGRHSKQERANLETGRGDFRTLHIDNHQVEPSLNHQAAAPARAGNSAAPADKQELSWKGYQAALNKEFTQPVWETWFEKSNAKILRGPDGFIVSVDKPFQCNWIQNHFVSRLERALGDVSVSVTTHTELMAGNERRAA